MTPGKEEQQTFKILNELYVGLSQVDVGTELKIVDVYRFGPSVQIRLAATINNTSLDSWFGVERLLDLQGRHYLLISYDPSYSEEEAHTPLVMVEILNSTTLVALPKETVEASEAVALKLLEKETSLDFVVLGRLLGAIRNR